MSMTQEQRHGRALALIHAAERALSISARQGDEWAPDRAAWRLAEAVKMLWPDLDPSTWSTVAGSLPPEPDGRPAPTAAAPG